MLNSSQVKNKLQSTDYSNIWINFGGVSGKIQHNLQKSKNEIVLKELSIWTSDQVEHSQGAQNRKEHLHINDTRLIIKNLKV